MEVRDLLKDKKFWVASFLIAWAAALQGHMMWMQRQDSFKQKFGTLKEDADNKDHDGNEISNLVGRKGGWLFGWYWLFASGLRFSNTLPK